VLHRRMEEEWLGWALTSSITWLALGAVAEKETMERMEDWCQRTSMNTKRRSLIVGQSCLWFLIPAYIKYTTGHHLWSLAFIFLTITSLMGDFVTTGRRSWWHGVDFWYAISVCTYTLCRQWQNAPWGKYVVLLGMYLCYFGSKNAARAPGGVAGNFRAYEFYHSNWHHIGAVFAAFTCGPYSIYTKYWPGQENGTLCDKNLAEGIHQTAVIFLCFLAALKLRWKATVVEQPKD